MGKWNAVGVVRHAARVGSPRVQDTVAKTWNAGEDSLGKMT